MGIGSLILSLGMLLSILVTFFDLKILRKLKQDYGLFIKVWATLAITGVVIFFSGYAFAALPISGNGG